MEAADIWKLVTLAFVVIETAGGDLAHLVAQVLDHAGRAPLFYGIINIVLVVVIYQTDVSGDAEIGIILLVFPRSLSKRFPFRIYYRLEDAVIRIYAVLDQRRDPTWIRRRVATGER